MVALLSRSPSYKKETYFIQNVYGVYVYKGGQIA
jgi:hypothetical protein